MTSFSPLSEDNTIQISNRGDNIPGIIDINLNKRLVPHALHSPHVVGDQNITSVIGGLRSHSAH